MVTEDPSSAETSGETAAERSVEGSSPKKRGQVKVPKKIHKAEREKLKRDQLNDLFSDLHNMLETDRQNNGKATILGDTSRILRDLITQVDALRKENAALVKESHYVTQENNELRDEKGMLQSEITDLQNQLQIRALQMGVNGYTNTNPGFNPLTPVPVTTIIPVPSSPPRELQLFPSPPVEAPSINVSVTRPQVRYPDLITGHMLTGRVRSEDEQDRA